jgi:hypothetical protein
VTDHVSELAIDRMLAGELPATVAEAARRHAAGCPRCGALFDDALAVSQTFAAPLALPRRRGWPVVVGALAVTAAIALVVRSRGTDDEGIRTKGSATLGFFVAHDGVVRRGAPGEQLAPGDAIELYSTSPDPRWLAVVSVDGAGVRSVYVAPRMVAAGRERVVPLSIILDGTLGVETVTGIFCPAPFDPAAPPAGCTTDVFTFVKVPR